MKFTLPLSHGDVPFLLTEKDKARSSDNWAWSFLRLNPYYRHDFNLVLARPDVQPHLLEAKRLILRFRMKTLPDEYTSIRHPMSLPPLPTELQKAVADLDSRYFMFNGEPLSPPRKQFSSEPATLQGWLNKQGGIANIAHLDIRDIDPARDYGIESWVHPDIQTLEELPSRDSWFHFINEPVWSAGTWALRPSNVLRTRIAESGRKVTVGLDRAVVVKEITERRPPDFLGETVKLVPGRPLPLSYGSTRSTELHFLICLDGYVEPQLNAVRPIADDLKALHREYFPKAIAKGSFRDFTPIIENPHDPATPRNRARNGLFNSVAQAPTRVRKNWRAITIDVAAPIVEQFTLLNKQLLAIQKSIERDLTFPLRKREGRSGEGHWLKKDLCVLELRFYGCGDEEGRPSAMAMARAFYDEDDPLYRVIRDESTVQKPTVLTGGNNAMNAYHPMLHVVKEALENAQNLALGWYEYIAWSGVNTKD